MKLLDVLEVTTKFFEKHQVESPRLTTELLLADVLGKTRLQLYLAFEEELSAPILDRLRPLVKLRSEGQPLQYVLGKTTFAGQTFTLTPDVLIPRPETELLLEAVIPLLGDPALPIADVGTGSGILAVSLARRFPQHVIHALDFSPAALAIAQANGQGLSNLTFHNSDLLTAAPAPVYQLIVANLPYIPTATIPQLSREVQREPLLALDGGPDGLDLIRRLITQAQDRTSILALEIGDGQSETVKKLLQAAGFSVTHCIQDLRSTERIVIGQKTHG
jgi:release factor glutamine methyltransferase